VLTRPSQLVDVRTDAQGVLLDCVEFAGPQHNVGPFDSWNLGERESELAVHPKRERDHLAAERIALIHQQPQSVQEPISRRLVRAHDFDHQLGLRALGRIDECCDRGTAVLGEHDPRTQARDRLVNANLNRDVLPC